VDQLRVLFADLPMTLLTLFMCITGGLNWWDVQQLLLKMSVVYACIFVFFVLVALLAAMNVITAIFVTDAVQMAMLDSDVKVQQQLEENQQYLQKISDLFRQIDANDVGRITLDDFMEQMKREEVRMNFALLGLDVADSEAFFKLLDVDHSVELEIDEFVMGCMRFRGNANLECSVLEAKQLMVKSMSRLKRIQAKVALIEDLMENLCLTHEVREPVPVVKARQRTCSDEVFRPPAWASDETSVSFTLGAHADDPPSMTPHVDAPIFDE